jgi:hypothetical protein
MVLPQARLVAVWNEEDASLPTKEMRHLEKHIQVDAETTLDISLPTGLHSKHISSVIYPQTFASPPHLVSTTSIYLFRFIDNRTYTSTNSIEYAPSGYNASRDSLASSVALSVQNVHENRRQEQQGPSKPLSRRRSHRQFTDIPSVIVQALTSRTLRSQSDNDPNYTARGQPFTLPGVNNDSFAYKPPAAHQFGYGLPPPSNHPQAAMEAWGIRLQQASAVVA